MAIETAKDIQQLKNRFGDLADKSFRQSCYTFTNFLGLSEQDILMQNEREYSYVGLTCFGGQEGCERVIARFGKAENLSYEQEFPIVCIRISPLIKKFSDALTHRDFLGAIMNLGIDRSTIGDLFVEDKECYMFCLESMADYLIDELEQVKHTHVKCERVALEEVKELKSATPESKTLQVSSERIDAVIAKVYNISRNQSIDLFREKKIFVNGKCQENNSYLLKDRDAVSVRGHGKFLFYGIQGETKKGKLNVLVGIFGRG